jgi:hypothetical protein
MIATLPVVIGLPVVVSAGSVRVLRESVAAGDAAGPARRRRRTATRVDVNVADSGPTRRSRIDLRSSGNKAHAPREATNGRGGHEP